MDLLQNLLKTGSAVFFVSGQHRMRYSRSEFKGVMSPRPSSREAFSIIRLRLFSLVLSLLALLLLSGCDYVSDYTSPQKDSIGLAEAKFLSYSVPRPWVLVEENTWTYKGKDASASITFRTGIKDERGVLAEIAKKARAALDEPKRGQSDATYLLSKNNRRKYSKEHSPDYAEVENQEKKLDAALEMLYKAKEHPGNIAKAKALLDEAAKVLSSLGSLEERLTRVQSTSGSVVAKQFSHHDLSGIPYLIATADYDWFGTGRHLDKFIFFELEGAYTLISFNGVMGQESVVDRVAQSMAIVKGGAAEVTVEPIGRSSSARRRAIDQKNSFAGHLDSGTKILLIYFVLVSLPVGWFAWLHYIGGTKPASARSAARAAAFAAIFFTIGVYLLLAVVALGTAFGSRGGGAGLMVGLGVFMFMIVKIVSAVLVSVGAGLGAALGGGLGGMAGRTGACLGAIGGVCIALAIISQAGGLNI